METGDKPPHIISKFVPVPPPAPIFVTTPAPQPPPDLSDDAVFKARCEAREASCRARVLEFAEGPTWEEAGFDPLYIDWYACPNVSWACRIPGCRQYGKQAYHTRDNLLVHLKSSTHAKLGRNPPLRLPPLDLRHTFDTFMFVAPPPPPPRLRASAETFIDPGEILAQLLRNQAAMEEGKDEGDENDIVMTEAVGAESRDTTMPDGVDTIGANVLYWRETGD
ncbi:hypothetical protein QBC39DRAFT_375614 [Podospora conica]|nr:hypothetical protein QBC39DRAFT_375614 [Schizothecium conicum]